MAEIRSFSLILHSKTSQINYGIIVNLLNFIFKTFCSYVSDLNILEYFTWDFEAGKDNQILKLGLGANFFPSLSLPSNIISYPDSL